MLGTQNEARFIDTQGVPQPMATGAANPGRRAQLSHRLTGTRSSVTHSGSNEWEPDVTQDESTGVQGASKLSRHCRPMQEAQAGMHSSTNADTRADAHASRNTYMHRNLHVLRTLTCLI